MLRVGCVLTHSISFFEDTQFKGQCVRLCSFVCVSVLPVHFHSLRARHCCGRQAFELLLLLLIDVLTVPTDSEAALLPWKGFCLS
jgi:hypothetical protein